MTFEVKPFITFAAKHPWMLVTKFGQNPLRKCGEKQIVRKKKKKEIART